MEGWLASWEINPIFVPWIGLLALHTHTDTDTQHTHTHTHTHIYIYIYMYIYMAKERDSARAECNMRSCLSVFKRFELKSFLQQDRLHTRV